LLSIPLVVSAFTDGAAGSEQLSLLRFGLALQQPRCAIRGNYKRKGFNQVIEQIELGLVKRLVIGYQDRFVRFGYDWFEQFCERHGTEIMVVNGESFSPEEELVRDLIAIVTQVENKAVLRAVKEKLCKSM
jgi:predicted site-specific integrase-resolvase